MMIPELRLGSNLRGTLPVIIARAEQADVDQHEDQSLTTLELQRNSSDEPLFDFKSDSTTN